MITDVMNDYEFEQMSMDGKLLSMFKNQRDIIKKVNITYGKVCQHEKELNALKVIGMVALIWIGVCTGTGTPFLPFL